MNLLQALATAVGEANVLTGDDAQPYLTDWRKRYGGRAQAVVRPGSTAEVAAVVRACAAARTPMVPQGGNTGLVGGGTPDASGNAVVISLQRMNRVRSIDTANDTITVEAGCVLQAVQQAAHEHGRLFPLSLAAEGSATIGGNLATNAGGTQVLRYGNARDLALGLEVVLASGETWDGLRGLRKDNTGYDLKHLFIGGEGTLGIITAATLKLYPLPAAQMTALAAVPSLGAAARLLERARAAAGAALTAFELMGRITLQHAVEMLPTLRTPLPLAQRFWAGLFTLYGIGFLGYSLVPAAGPWVSLAGQFAVPLTGGWITDLNARVIGAGSNGVDVFPSLHCAVSAYCLFFDLRHKRWRFFAYVVPCVGLWLSTVYLRYHYLIDLVAGFALAAVVLEVARRFTPASMQGRGAEP